MELTIFWQFMADMTPSLVGAFVGFGLALLGYYLNKRRERYNRKKELYSQIGKEIDGIISAIENPKALNPEYIPFVFEPTLRVINGGQLNMRLTADIYATSSASLGVLPYDLVDLISAVAIDIAVYSQQVDDIHKFNYETVPTDPARREIVGKQLIDNAKLQINAILLQCRNVKEELEKTK